MTYNEFEGNLRDGTNLSSYKDQTSGPQCGLSLEVSLYICMWDWSVLVVYLFYSENIWLHFQI